MSACFVNTSPLKQGIREDENSVSYSLRLRTTGILRVELFGIAALNGWYVSSKAKYWWETDSEQVPWGKDEKNFEKRVKKYLKLLRGKRWKSVLDGGVMSFVYWSVRLCFLQRGKCCTWRIGRRFLTLLLGQNQFGSVSESHEEGRFAASKS